MGGRNRVTVEFTRLKVDFLTKVIVSSVTFKNYDASGLPCVHAEVTTVFLSKVKETIGLDPVLKPWSN